MESLLKFRRFLEAPPRARSPMVPACELCAGPAGSQHSHVIDLESRRLLCTCRPCYLLFTHPGAGAGRFRSVSERYLRINQPALATTHLDALQIPVGIAFFLSNSKLGRVIAFFPSPAGATESGLSLESWREMVDAAPELAAMESDVEALLLCRRGERSISWIVPVDACYELVGRIRKTWRGFEGGEEAWAEIDSFLAGLEQRETRDAA